MEQKNGYTLFAAADCTGHGVPGAMVSVVCNNGLNRAVREYGITDPGKILDKTREIVSSEFEKSEDNITDGMDIALCALKGSELLYAGAYNPLWIIKKNTETVQEIKANRQSIGKLNDPKLYTTHKLNIQSGDTIYLFSDGFKDQFGGERNKKLGTKGFKELLLSIQHKSMEEQHHLLLQAFEKWKGENPQIDDMCVIGFKIETGII